MEEIATVPPPTVGARASVMRGQWTLAALACLTGVVTIAALVLLHGRVPGAMVVGVVIAATIGAIGRPRWGYYLLVSVTILADRHLWNFSPWTDGLGFYVFQNWWKLLSPTGDDWFRPIVVNTVDVLLSGVVLGAALEAIRERQRPLLPRVAMLGALYLGTLIVMLGYGLATGGELKPALWQARPHFHFIVLGLVTPQILRTAGAIRGAVWAVMIPSIFKALQIDWIFFVEEHAHFGTWREILGHEDSVFFVAAITLAVVLALYRPTGVKRWLLLMSVPFTLVGLAVNLRRAAYVALVLTLGLIPLLAHGRRRRALKAALPVLVLLSLYLGAYWNRPDAAFGLPAQKLKSVWLAQVGTSDYDSNLYRVGENLNLRRTIVGHPLGLGFGHPFELHVPLPDISFLLPYWQYHPHNMILGMWLELGSIGFVVFLSYFGSRVVLASHCLRRHTDPHLKAVSYLALTGLIAGFLVGMVDQMIWSERGAIFLGVLAGLAAALYGLRPEERAPEGVAGAPTLDRTRVAESDASRGGPRAALRVSVIIATYNRRHLLAEVLQAMSRQSTPPGTFEVVVVDDGSVDGTAEWLATQTFPFDCKVLRQTNQGPSAARNAGVRVSRGDILVFLDDDFVPDRDLLQEHMRIHDAEDAVVVMGPARSLPHYRQPWIAWQQATLERAYDAMARGDLQPSFREFWAGNCSVARERVVAVGGFDQSLRCNEDVELGYRLMSHGLHFRFNASARGLHHSARSFAGWSATHRAYGQLNVGIFRRLGEGAMYLHLAGDWSRRHPLTRWLVRRTVGRRGRMRIAAGVLRACIGVATLVPMSRFSHVVCAALANMLYWDGVAQALGQGAALCATLEAGERRA